MTEVKFHTTPHPGSDAAVEAGCTCPVMDNARGRGVTFKDGSKGWWMTAGCPLHGQEIEIETETS